MIRMLVRRVLRAFIILFGITIVDYSIMSRTGSPLDLVWGARVSKEAIDRKAEMLGLNKPVIQQYLEWLWQLLHGNFGVSMRSYQPVSSLIGQYIGSTLLLTSTALLFSLLVSVPLGVYAALRHNSWVDKAIVTFSYVFGSVPGFFLSLVLIAVFAVRLGWFPTSGISNMGSASWSAGDVIHHMVLPVIVLSNWLIGADTRYVRSAMLETLHGPFLKTFRALGVSNVRIVLSHALRNALLPIITVVGMQIPMLLGGSIVVEQIFNWPGLGLMTMSAILDRDYPVIMAMCLISAIMVLISNLIADVLYAVVDPRVRDDIVKEA